MPLENEIKLEIDKPVKLEEKLRELGAEYQGTQVQYDTYYQRSHSRIEGENIRLRRVVQNTGEFFGYLAYKTPLDSSAEFLSREELETRVDDPNVMLEILARLGYEIIDRIMKTRKQYKLGEINIGVDFVPGVGDFVEIEVGDNEIKQLAAKLGLDPDRRINKSYSALREEKNETGNIDNRTASIG